MVGLSLPPPRNQIKHNNEKQVLSSLKSKSDEESNHIETETSSEKTPTTSSTSTTVTTTAAAGTATSLPSVAEEVLVPSYEERCRTAQEFRNNHHQYNQNNKNQNNRRPFIPRRLQDFQDGGAFPEIHVAQYPRNMGRPQQTSSSRAIVNVTVNEKGDVSYDAIVKSGTNKDKLVYTKYEDMKEAKQQDIALPTPQQVQEEAARTHQALMALVNQQTALDKPSGTAVQNAATSQNVEEKTQFIRYQADPSAPGYNPAAAQRVIQMVPRQVDPMAPPKHKHIKAPRGPAEDPVPVLHAPPTKLTKEEREQWQIPTSISNWKNPRGFTIPLDKRLAADGRGLRDDNEMVNNKFASLAESLYVAEKQARQEVQMRAQVQKKLALQEKEKREQELRELANQARRQNMSGRQEHNDDEEVVNRQAGEDTVANRASSIVDYSSDSGSDDASEKEDEVAARQRERLRMERRKERERELRLDRSMEAKKRKLEEERDVSEKIALGAHIGGGLTEEMDSRLYSQSAGMDSGFGRDDEYNTYTKPLFDRQGVTSSSIYRPTRGETNADEQYASLQAGTTTRFQPDQGFAGAEGGGQRGAGRNAPVQFERERKSS